ncbi:hypothetical protein [Limnospira fusiformis]|uniref:hypothetical protein n=1 Tax=Limnospira fusiformis TaxID=54297 RepID=UPI001449826D|nr:hypothetical protein HFV01_13350 [Limnospira fusiformis SAG 85.79]
MHDISSSIAQLTWNIHYTYSLTNIGAIAFFFPQCDRLTKNPVSLSHRKCDRYLILRNPVSYQNLGEDTKMVVETRFL